MKHTPTPWKAEGSFIFAHRNDHRFPIGSMMHMISKECQQEFDINNAKRIVECVNALEGIASPIDFVSAAKALNPHDVINAVKERDHLRNVLLEVKNDLCRLSAEMTIEDCDIVNNLALKIEKYEQ